MASNSRRLLQVLNTDLGTIDSRGCNYQRRQQQGARRSMNRSAITTADTYRVYFEPEFRKDRQGWHWYNTESSTFENDFVPF